MPLRIGFLLVNFPTPIHHLTNGGMPNNPMGIHGNPLWRRDSSFPTPDVQPRSSLLGDEALNVSDLPGDPTSRCVDFHVCVGQPGIWGSYRIYIPT